MQITIISTLTEEQALILAKEKGYSEYVYTLVDSSTTPETYSTVPSSQSPYEFLKNVYENMIKEDAKKLFIAYDDRLNIDAKNAREQGIKDMVDAAFI